MSSLARGEWHSRLSHHSPRGEWRSSDQCWVMRCTVTDCQLWGDYNEPKYGTCRMQTDRVIVENKFCPHFLKCIGFNNCFQIILLETQRPVWNCISYIWLCLHMYNQCMRPNYQPIEISGSLTKSVKSNLVKRIWDLIIEDSTLSWRWGGNWLRHTYLRRV